MKLHELNDYSFATKGGFMSAGGHPKGADFDGASSIGDDDNVAINLPPSDSEKQLQQRVATLEDELVTYKKQLESARSNNSQLNTS